MNIVRKLDLVWVIALLCCMIYDVACSGSNTADNPIEDCQDEPEQDASAPPLETDGGSKADANACPVCPDPPPACMTCAEIVLMGGDARHLCDGDQVKFYDVWECVVDAPQCTTCQAPGYPYAVFTPYALPFTCIECLKVEGCAASLSVCGFAVSP